MKNTILAMFGIGAYIFSVLSSAEDLGGSAVAPAVVVAISGIATAIFIILAIVRLWKEAKGLSISLATSSIILFILSLKQGFASPSYGSAIVILLNIAKVAYFVAYMWVVVKLFRMSDSHDIEEDNTEKKREGLVNALISIFGLYVISCAIAALYFNYQYARENGFVKWALLGQFAPTAKAIVWPYFALTAERTNSSNAKIVNKRADQVPATELAEGLNEPEMSQIVTELRAAMETGLSDGGSIKIREILKGYVKRKGSFLSKLWYEQHFDDLHNLSEYKYELGRSALLSWDAGQYSVTPEFADLREIVSRFVPGPQLSEDTRMLESASRHDAIITDSEGGKYRFDREDLLSGVNHRDKQRLELRRVLEIINEFVR